jgi:hypothetical protein
MKYLEKDHPRMDYPRASRQIGSAAALALFFVSVAYVIITTAGGVLVIGKSPWPSRIKFSRSRTPYANGGFIKRLLTSSTRSK